MSYDKSFYELYSDYLREPTVRKNHNFIFEFFASVAHQRDLFVVDLGCGLGEYEMYGRYKDYAGIDLNNVGRVKNFFRTDYHDLKFVRHLPFAPTSFVSLFSIECFHNARDKYALYDRIFSEIPSIAYGLSGGFFYEKRKTQETVGEAGEIVSYQTIEDPSLYISPLYVEMRIHIRTPSAMFGDDVVEVWKIFIRR